jgi:hypothetical protein
MEVRSETERRAFFTASDPHVVFYFGHGIAGSRPAVRVGPGRRDWLPLEQLADYASDVHPFPASWVFIACSIGEALSREAGPAHSDNRSDPDGRVKSKGISRLDRKIL